MFCIILIMMNNKKKFEVYSSKNILEIIFYVKVDKYKNKEVISNNQR